MTATTAPPRRIDLDAVAAAWQRALDGDDRALAAIGLLEGSLRIETGELHRSLRLERRDVAALLERAAPASRASF